MNTHHTNPAQPAASGLPVIPPAARITAFHAGGDVPTAVDSPARPSFTPGTKPIGRAAYVRLDGQAGITKLFGVVTAETAAYVTFVPDRDCYRFRKGAAKRVRKEHVRYQLVEYTEDCAVAEAKGGVA